MVRKFNNSKYYFYGDGKFENCASQIIPSVRYTTIESLKVRFIVTYIQTIYVLATYVATGTIWLCLGISGPGGPFIAS